MTLAEKLGLAGRRPHLVDPPSPLGLPRNGPDSETGPLVVFVRDRRALDRHRERIVVSAGADRLTWVAYPKGDQLGTDLNRDSVAAALLGDGIRPVSQISVDAVWSALRFRPGSVPVAVARSRGWVAPAERSAPRRQTRPA